MQYLKNTTIGSIVFDSYSVMTNICIQFQYRRYLFVMLGVVPWSISKLVTQCHLQWTCAVMSTCILMTPWHKSILYIAVPLWGESLVNSLHKGPVMLQVIPYYSVRNIVLWFTHPIYNGMMRMYLLKCAVMKIIAWCVNKAMLFFVSLLFLLIRVVLNMNILHIINV